MADDIKVETDRIKKLMQELLRRVPASVINGHHGTAVEYKKVAVQANKLLASAAPKFAVLQQTYTQLSAFR